MVSQWRAKDSAPAGVSWRAAAGRGGGVGEGLAAGVVGVAVGGGLVTSVEADGAPWVGTEVGDGSPPSHPATASATMAAARAILTPTPQT